MKVLVTGASGLVGSKLIQALVEKGHQVHAIGRKSHPDTATIKYFTWNIERGEIDKQCIEKVDAIIHLAGENIGKKPWSKRVRTTILKSRTDSIALIYQLLDSNPHQVKHVISASGTGYYGNRRNELLTEDRTPADDFLGQTCFEWELAVAKGRTYGLRIVSLRSGIILDKKKGALPKMVNAIRLGLGASLGNGKQYMPWIHLDDAVNTYLFALENLGIQGVYNMVAPETVTNQQLNQAIAKTLGKPLWLPPVPAFVLKSILGKMSEVLLDSAKVSPEKIVNAGFQFKYPTIKEALEAIYTA